MIIENEDMYFIVHITDKEKLTGITEILEEKLSIFTFTASNNGSQFLIQNSAREKFNRIMKTQFKDKQLSLF